jgi:hypothetical protein
MARLYLDEDVPVEVAKHLRSFGHDVETTDEAGRKSSDDPAQLAYATSTNRAIITHNRKHFRRLHRGSTNHAGIVECTRDDGDPSGLAARIDQAVSASGDMTGRIVRVYRPS